MVLHAGMDMKSTLAGKHPWLLYALAPAMRPRMLLTLDEQAQLLSCPVRVGQAVDVVAQVSPTSWPTHAYAHLMCAAAHAAHPGRAGPAAVLLCARGPGCECCRPGRSHVMARACTCTPDKCIRACCSSYTSRPSCCFASSPPGLVPVHMLVPCSKVEHG